MRQLEVPVVENLRLRLLGYVRVVRAALLLRSSLLAFLLELVDFVQLGIVRLVSNEALDESEVELAFVQERKMT